MQCQECAHDNSPGSRFCTTCGTRLNVVCTACGRSGLLEAQFCSWCGASRAEDPRLAEPGGERKQATVLFADIVGSTELIAGLDAEAAMDRLEPLVKAMARAVRRFDGTVLRTLGDGIKAAFGVPHAQEGHALLACQAALAMQSAVATISDTVRIRVGLHAGEVVAGTLNTGSAVEQEAQGMTVHLASRIEQAASPGDICISRACRDLVVAYCDTTATGIRALKGISQPVEIYRLNGLKPAVNSDHFRGAGLTQLRGRIAELASLQQSLLDAGEGGPNVVGIAGFAGVGKSRLCFEFGEWCRGRNVQVLEARAHVFGQATPLLPILELLRTFFRISPQLDPDLARQRITKTLLALDPSLVASLPLLSDFLNVAGTAPATILIDPRARHARLREVVVAMVKAAGRQVSVIIVEDLHWLDEASHDFVAAMTEAVCGTNIVMLVTFRPPWSARWTAQDHYREMRLVELDQREMRQLVRDLTGGDAALDTAVVRIADQSGGNPFFAEELVLSLAQSGVLMGTRGQYHLGPSGWQNAALPPTVEAVIGARIDRLSERQKAVLQIGAVIGKEFAAAVVQVVGDIPAPALQALFDRLCEAELIQPCMTEAGASFAFRHPLIQEVAYAMQLRTRRTRLHETVANAIASFDWGLRDEFAGLLSYHHESAGQELEAAFHLQRAARWIGRTNSARALSDWKKVRRMMQGQPRSETNDQLRALAGGQLLTFGWREGMAPEEAKLYADEALHFAREAGNRKHEVLLLGAYGRIMAASGPADDYVRRVNEALALTDPASNPEGHLLLTGLLCQACTRAGLLVEALAANDVAMAAMDSQNQSSAGIVLSLNVAQMVGFDVAHWVRCLRAKILVALGQFAAANLWLARLFQIEPENIEPFHQFIPHAAAIEMAWYHGDPLAAKWHASELSRHAEQSAIPFVLVAAQLGHGISASTGGDYDAAERHFRQALTAARQGRAGLENEAKLQAHLADAYIRAGDEARAAHTAAEAMQTARQKTDRCAECHAAIVGSSALATLRQIGWRNEATQLLNRAETLIITTGATIFQPMLERAQRLVESAEP